MKYYETETGDKGLKDMLKAILKANLFKKHVLFVKPHLVTSDVLGVWLPPSLLKTGLSFWVAQEMILIQCEQEKFKLKAQLEKELRVCQQMEQIMCTSSVQLTEEIWGSC